MSLTLMFRGIPEYLAANRQGRGCPVSEVICNLSDSSGAWTDSSYQVLTFIIVDVMRTQPLFGGCLGWVTSRAGRRAVRLLHFAAALPFMPLTLNRQWHSPTGNVRYRTYSARHDRTTPPL